MLVVVVLVLVAAVVAAAVLSVAVLVLVAAVVAALLCDAACCAWVEGSIVVPAALLSVAAVVMAPAPPPCDKHGSRVSQETWLSNYNGSHPTHPVQQQHALLLQVVLTRVESVAHIVAGAGALASPGQHTSLACVLDLQ